jgi:hypothetical protein
MMSSNMNHAAVVALQYLISLSLAPLVKYSIGVIMYLAPMRFPGGFIGPMNLVAHSQMILRSAVVLKAFHLFWKVSQLFDIHHKLCNSP